MRGCYRLDTGVGDRLRIDVSYRVSLETRPRSAAFAPQPERPKRFNTCPYLWFTWINWILPELDTPGIRDSSPAIRDLPGETAGRDGEACQTIE